MPATATETTLTTKYATLCQSLRERLAGGLLIAFSGGVDSAFLLWAAEQERRANGGQLLALTTLSASLAGVEKEDAIRFAQELGVEHLWRESHEVSNPAYLVNDSTRCYHCKTELFRLAHETAQVRGLQSIAYGFNASDRGDYRPGHRAAQENAILAPLDAAGLTKDDIRQLMREYNLDLADKPASPCLSSRLMTGVAITPRKLKDIEELEKLLRLGGLRVFRVRVHEDGAQKFLRVEVALDELPQFLTLREQLVAAGQLRGYRWVTLDLAGYRTGGANLTP
jgi:uncharacterized protein